MSDAVRSPKPTERVDGMFHSARIGVRGPAWDSVQRLAYPIRTAPAKLDLGTGRDAAPLINRAKPTMRQWGRKTQGFRDRFSFSWPTFGPRAGFHFALFFGIVLGFIGLGATLIYLPRVLGMSTPVARVLGVNTEAAAPKTGETKSLTPTAPDTALGTTETGTTDQGDIIDYFQDISDAEFQAKIREAVKGYPIESMLPDIFAQDRLIATFLIGIGRKESAWGKRVPVLNGEDCLNYWGYRGIRDRMGSGGHTCFDNRKDAVETVAKRLQKLIYSEKLNTPEKLIVWKCGYSCSGHSRESVKKWISDVDYYYQQFDEYTTE